MNYRHYARLANKADKLIIVAECPHPDCNIMHHYAVYFHPNGAFWHLEPLYPPPDEITTKIVPINEDRTC